MRGGSGPTTSDYYGIFIWTALFHSYLTEQYVLSIITGLAVYTPSTARPHLVTNPGTFTAHHRL